VGTQPHPGDDEGSVALGGGEGAHRNRTRATQASPPFFPATPAPTGTKPLARRHYLYFYSMSQEALALTSISSTTGGVRMRRP
jgi:hypothetical protein